jgi:predicted amidophosphoribosyltransferase
MSPTIQIFLDPVEDKSSEVFYLGNYYSPSNPKFKADSFSKTILDIKAPMSRDMTAARLPRRLQNMKRAVEYFRSQLDSLLGKGFSIAIVPPSKSGPNRSGLPALAQQLAANGRIDASQCLVRHTDIPAQHEGGSRDFGRHLATIRVEHVELVRGKRVLLLDDVGTTGTSLGACTKLLLDAGASAVKCAALGRTSNF